MLYLFERLFFAAPMGFHKSPPGWAESKLGQTIRQSNLPVGNLECAAKMFNPSHGVSRAVSKPEQIIPLDFFLFDQVL